MLHKNFTGDAAVHVANYYTSSDPGAVGANKDWYDTTTTPPTLKRRNAGNTAWTTLGQLGAVGGAASEVLVAEWTADGTTGTHTFSGIAATYRDVRVVVRGRGDTAAGFANVRLEINGDTSAIYDYQRVYGNGASSASPEGVYGGTYADIGWLPAATAPTSAAGQSDATVYNYRDTTFHKSGNYRSALKNGASLTGLFSGSGAFWWRNTAAVTALRPFLSAGNFVSGSVISLYGNY